MSLTTNRPSSAAILSSAGVVCSVASSSAAGARLFLSAFFSHLILRRFWLVVPRYAHVLGAVSSGFGAIRPRHTEPFQELHFVEDFPIFFRLASPCGVEAQVRKRTSDDGQPRRVVRRCLGGHRKTCG